MFRTITVYSGEKISVDQNRMVVTGENGEQYILIEDIYSLVIDNPRTLLTVPVITRLTGSGAHIILCDEKHLPSSIILPHSLHYHPLTVLRRQLAMPDDIKDRIWDKVIKQKIVNQAKVLQICTGKRERASRLLELADEVANGDEGNREGISARIFFHEMYGFEFVRMYDDATNAALNYGYTVIRSSVAKTLVAYGYNCVYGVHHINESNPFNLADDMMEPLRPAVDMWVSDNKDGLVDSLTRQQKNELASIVNSIVLFDGKKMKMRNAIDRYISSLTTALTRLDPSLLKLPEMIRPDIYNEEDD